MSIWWRNSDVTAETVITQIIRRLYILWLLENFIFPEKKPVLNHSFIRIVLSLKQRDIEVLRPPLVDYLWECLCLCVLATLDISAFIPKSDRKSDRNSSTLFVLEIHYCPFTLWDFDPTRHIQWWFTRVCVLFREV